MTQDFRLYLQDQLDQRTSRNPNYSLRAFARSIGVSSSELSKYLTGKRRVSAKKFQEIAPRLDLSPQVFEHYAETFDRTRSVAIYHKMRYEAFSVLANWYHMAIVELTKTKDFKATVPFIANRLGLREGQVRDALTQLSGTGYLQKVGRKWQPREGNTSSVDEAESSQAARSLQRQILTKAQAALDEVPFANRDQSAIVIAADSRKIPEAKKRIAKFRRDLADFLESPEDNDEVYYLTVSLFPVSHPTRSPRRSR